MTLEADRAFEAAWWGTCIHTYAEETKQITYAKRMNIISVTDETHSYWPYYELGSMRVLDIGGGPCSLLLKSSPSFRPKDRVVVDPQNYPAWVHARYATANIQFVVTEGETFDSSEPFDETWIYNVLQHTPTPEKIVANARRLSRRIRIFEWIDIPPYLGHPSELKADKLNEWLDGRGTTEWMQENRCSGGRAYYGIFPGLVEK